MKSRHIKAQITSFCFILPALSVLALLLLYPVVTSVFYSFTSKHLIKADYEFVFFKNYIAVLTDPDFWTSFLTNIKWTITSLFFQIVVGFLAALAVDRIRKGKSFFRTILIIPWAFPSIVIALSWKWILNGVSGFLPNILVKMGIVDTVPQFLSSANLAFPVLVMINVWFGAPLIGQCALRPANRTQRPIRSGTGGRRFTAPILHPYHAAPYPNRHGTADCSAYHLDFQQL